MKKRSIQFNDRYSRQLALPQIRPAGQARLLSSSVLVVGAGGLASPACLYLAAAGVGTIGIVDDDKVELSNLQRQVMHATPSIGQTKVRSGARTMRTLNPDVRVNEYRRRLTPQNALELLDPYDFVIDATDNLPSKFAVAEACHAAGKPYSHAGISEFLGQTITVLPGKTCCYRCVFEAIPCPSRHSRPRGPVGAVPGVIGSIQAMEAIKCILRIGTLLVNRLLIYDALNSDFRTIALKRSPRCPLCGSRSLRDAGRAVARS